MIKEIVNRIGVGIGIVGLLAGIAGAEPSKDYRSHLAKEGLAMFRGNLYVAKNYDVNKDGIPEVGELYRPEGDMKEPLFYAFNKNQNRRFENEEILFDEAEDGLNGNELPLN